MSYKTDSILTEMVDVFGNEFGSELPEASRPMPRKEPSPKGLLGKKDDSRFQRRKGKSSKSGVLGKKGAKSLAKSAAKKSKEKESKKSSSGGGSSGSGGIGKGKTDLVKTPAHSKGGRSQHYAFKRSPNLGAGPRGTHHDETKCWKCSCSKGSYNGCECVASGSGKNCPPPGTKKTIKIKRDYKQEYNRQYHKWRADQGGRVTARLGSKKEA